MLGVVKRGKGRYLFVASYGIDYFAYDPKHTLEDGDLVWFAPGASDKGPVANDIMKVRGKDESERETT